MKENQLTGAVDIGGTKIQVALVDTDNRICGTRRFDTDSRHRSGQQMIDRLVHELTELSKQQGIALSHLRGIAIACAGPVDTEKGTIENPYTLPGWEGFPLVRELEEKTSLPVRLENDANGALLGEVCRRELWDQDVLMITVGTGIGVASWSRGELFRCGRYHPEMGHMVISSDGSPCYCGHRGCFESLCSGRAMNVRARSAGYADFDELCEQSGQGDERARTLLTAMMRDFKTGVWNLCVIFKPDTVILTGGVAQRHFLALEKVLTEERVENEAFIRPFCVLPASDGQNSALLAANMLFK